MSQERLSEFFRMTEEKWLERWEREHIYEADPKPGKPKCFVTFPYPYQNGPLHIGHGFSATRADVYARFKRMQGYNVLFPWAWHLTGEAVFGTCERIKMGDERVIRALRDIDGVPGELIDKFVDPVFMVKYYMRVNKEAVRRIGFSIDWRREFYTTSLHPAYDRFIKWQYKVLREKGYVIKATRPVVWCPKCKSPTGDHDRLEGEGVNPEEYVLIKFKGEDNVYLVAATFRPETLFGATNIWVKPDGSYVEAEVEGERWIVSEEAANKLIEQLRSVKILRRLKGSEIIGKYFENPVNGKKLIVLPASFVDTSLATGVVYSVPAHAPYDYAALVDLKKNPEELKSYGIDPSVLKGLNPISIIRTEGYGEYPAEEIVKKMGITNQRDPRLEEATKLIYKKEYHTGYMKENCGEFAGLPVKVAKEQITEKLKGSKLADAMYDLPSPVICRCTTRCIVKMLKDQWFLKYSDPEWKEKTLKCLNNMKVYPEEAKSWFKEVITQMPDRACMRKTGLGTTVDWAPGWIIETLSDSTIYMAFYTIAKYVNSGLVKPENLTYEFFDYVFLGKGEVKEVSEKTGLPPKLLEEIRQEFLYWYPVDLRNSAKELLPNHLTYFLFHHTAIFPEKHWPRAVGVNGMVFIEGKKMSKSKGNFIPLIKAVEKYGADPTRVALMLAAEDMDDPDWREKNVLAVQKHLHNLYNLAKQTISLPSEGKEEQVDRWLISRLQTYIAKVTSALENLKNRTALQTILFDILNDVKWYMKRKKEPCKRTLMYVLDKWVRMLAPFAPFTAEEIWEVLGNKTFVSLEKWPAPEKEKIDLKAELEEKYLVKVIEDTREAIKATGLKPKLICYYVAPPWKMDVYAEVVSAKIKGVDPSKLIGELAKRYREKAKEVVKLVKNLVKDLGGLSEEELKIRASQSIDEYGVLTREKEFLSREFNAEIRVYWADDKDIYDPKGRAKLAVPWRPALYIEGEKIDR